ncbi:MAG: GNAT family N-acetyltransferase [Chloroflexota bacterium]|nr:GNAT family N-acetyltransferase [Chloroflexota bacterium]
MSNIDVNALETIHNPDASRFEITLDGTTAVSEYRLTGKTIIFTHTDVPTKFEGMGIGSKLTKDSLDYAVAQGWRIEPQCPFVASYIQRHPEYQPHTRGYGE